MSVRGLFRHFFDTLGGEAREDLFETFWDFGAPRCGDSCIWGLQSQQLTPQEFSGVTEVILSRQFSSLRIFWRKTLCTFPNIGDRQGTTKKLCDQDFAERSSELLVRFASKP